MKRLFIVLMAWCVVCSGVVYGEGKPQKHKLKKQDVLELCRNIRIVAYGIEWRRQNGVDITTQLQGVKRLRKDNSMVADLLTIIVFEAYDYPLVHLPESKELAAQSFATKQEQDCYEAMVR